MTLIASYRDVTTGFLSISDILTSRETDTDISAIDLPFRDAPISHRNGKSVTAGYRQKSIPFGRTLIMWSGNALISALIINAIRRASEDGIKHLVLREVIDSLDINEKQRDELCIFYHYHVDGNHIDTETFNHSFESTSKDYQLIGDGSGFWNFFGNIQNKPRDNASSSDARFADLLTKTLFHAVIEHSSFESLDYMYGGWFELTRSRGLSFEKIPYAIKFWSMHNGTLGSGGPVFFGWYENDNLAITRLKFQETDEGVQSSHEIFTVSGYFCREVFSLPPTNIHTPEFIAHIVFNSNQKTQDVVVQQYDESKMILQVSPEGIRCCWKNALRYELIDLDIAEPSMWLSSQVE